MINLLIKFCTIVPLFSFISILIIKLLNLNNINIEYLFIILFIIGFIVHIIINIIFYIDTSNRNMSFSEIYFWNNLLKTCLYQFAGLPVYYKFIIKKENIRNKQYNVCTILYYIVKSELYCTLVVLVAAVFLSLLSLNFFMLIDYPDVLFKIAIILILLFHFTFYFFYLSMLETFVSESNDTNLLIYYFGMGKWVFGVFEFYNSLKKEVPGGSEPDTRLKTNKKTP